jgi:heme-degrading monooxygenase HmoA
VSELDGVGTVRLSRDLRDPGRYVSFSTWDSFEEMRAWKDSDEFRPRRARVQEHVAEFAPTEPDVVVRLDRGAKVAVR